MVAIYRNLAVTTLREACEGDPDYDSSNKAKQVLIKTADGVQIAVPKAEVTENGHEVRVQHEVSAPKETFHPTPHKSASNPKTK